MKLNEIDVLVAQRQVYQKRLEQVKFATHSCPGKVQLVWQGRYIDIDDADIMVAVSKVLFDMVQTKLNESKTRLMMLGVDEFPE